MDARIFGLTSIVFATAWALPSTIHRMDFRALRKAEVISLERSSPAYGALRDVRANYRADRTIQSSSVVYETLLTNPNQLSLPTVVTRLEIKPKVITQLTGKDHLAELIVEQQNDQKKVMPQRTYQEVAQRLVQNELVRQNHPGGQKDLQIRTIQTQGGGEIIVSKPVQIVSGKSVTFLGVNPSPAPADKKSEPAPRTIAKRQPTFKSDQREQKESSSADKSYAREEETKGSSGGISAAAFVPSKPTRYQLRGFIKFVEGAVLIGRRDQIIAYQKSDDVVVAEGQVNVNEAEFFLQTDILEGQLVAEIKNGDGIVTARGIVNLYDLGKKSANKAKISEIEVAVRPTTAGVQADVISAANIGNKSIPLSAARLFIADLDREILRNKKSGLFNDEALMAPSDYFLVAKYERHWPTIKRTQSGQVDQLRVFPESYVQSILDMSFDKNEVREAKLQGIVWGRVTQMGRTVEGAKVEILDETSARPLYFSGFLPDKTRTQTSTNGEFVIPRLEPGPRLIQVQLGGKTYWPTLVEVERRMISYADLVLIPKQTMAIESFEAFSRNPLSTVMQPFGTKQEIFIDESGQGNLEVEGIKGQSYIESDPGEEYVMTRIDFRMDQTELKIPHLKQSWMTAIRGEQRPYKGLAPTQAVGFVNGDDFEVTVGDGQTENLKIAYFNELGEPVPSGVAGGGFIIFDLLPGTQTITILPRHSKNVMTRVIYVDDRATHVTRFNLML